MTRTTTILVVSSATVERLEKITEALAEEILKEPRTMGEPIVRHLQELDSLVGALVHRVGLAEEALAASPPAPRRAPTEMERFARALLRTALTRIERDPACLATEARLLVRHVRAGTLDGGLARRAVADAATAAGMAPDEVDRILAAVTREAS